MAEKRVFAEGLKRQSPKGFESIVAGRLAPAVVGHHGEREGHDVEDHEEWDDQRVSVANESAECGSSRGGGGLMSIWVWSFDDGSAANGWLSLQPNFIEIWEPILGLYSRGQLLNGWDFWREFSFNCATFFLIRMPLCTVLFDLIPRRERLNSE